MPKIRRRLPNFNDPQALLKQMICGKCREIKFPGVPCEPCSNVAKGMKEHKLTKTDCWPLRSKSSKERSYMAKRKREIFARLNGTRSKVLAFLSLKSIVSCLTVTSDGSVTIMPSKHELIANIVSSVVPEIGHWLEDQLWNLKERDLKKGINEAEKFEEEIQRVFYKPEREAISADQQKLDDTLSSLKAIKNCAQESADAEQQWNEMFG